MLLLSIAAPFSALLLCPACKASCVPLWNFHHWYCCGCPKSKEKSSQATSVQKPFDAMPYMFAFCSHFPVFFKWAVALTKRSLFCWFADCAAKQCNTLCQCFSISGFVWSQVSPPLAMIRSVFLNSAINPELWISSIVSLVSSVRKLMSNSGSIFFWWIYEKMAVKCFLLLLGYAALHVSICDVQQI